MDKFVISDTTTSQEVIDYLSDYENVSQYGERFHRYIENLSFMLLSGEGSPYARSHIEEIFIDVIGQTFTLSQMIDLLIKQNQLYILKDETLSDWLLRINTIRRRLEVYSKNICSEQEIIQQTVDVTELLHIKLHFLFMQRDTHLLWQEGWASGYEAIFKKLYPYKNPEEDIFSSYIFRSRVEYYAPKRKEQREELQKIIDTSGNNFSRRESALVQCLTRDIRYRMFSDAQELSEIHQVCFCSAHKWLKYLCEIHDNCQNFSSYEVYKAVRKEIRGVISMYMSLGYFTEPEKELIKEKLVLLSKKQYEEKCL